MSGDVDDGDMPEWVGVEPCIEPLRPRVGNVQPASRSVTAISLHSGAAV